MKSDPCKDACKRLLNSPEIYNNIEDVIISSIICIACIPLCVLFIFILKRGEKIRQVKNCIRQLLSKKPENKLELSEVTSSDLQEAKKCIHKQEQMEVKDVSASCNKQPKDIVFYKKSLIDGVNCSEKEKHNNFISCGEFANNSTHCLAAHNVCNEIDTVKKFTLCTIDLTVKLIVGCVSNNRTQNNRLSKQRGESFTFTGTGRVVKVNKSDKPCICPKHMNQGGFPKWTVDITTTIQVVFDEEEAKFTTAELFDDEDKSGAKIKSLQGEWFHKTDRPGECVVRCETCEEDLCEKLASLLTEQRELFKHLPFNNDTFFVVSHPHGKSKHICFGRRSQVRDYSDVTCPGCYGASLLMLHSESSPVHIGVNGKGYGVSTTGPSMDEDEDISTTRPLEEVPLMQRK